MTEKEICQLALDVQNASNLSGVVHSFSQVVTALRALPDCTGTAWVNTHPATRLFVDKLASLSGLQGEPLGGDSIAGAYGAAQRLAGK